MNSKHCISPTKSLFLFFSVIKDLRFILKMRMSNYVNSICVKTKIHFR